MRMKYEINAAHIDTEGEEIWLNMTIAHETGDDTIDLKIGRGTEVMVDIDALTDILDRVAQERRSS